MKAIITVVLLVTILFCSVIATPTDTKSVPPATYPARDQPLTGNDGTGSDTGYGKVQVQPAVISSGSGSGTGSGSDPTSGSGSGSDLGSGPQSPQSPQPVAAPTAPQY